MSRLIIDPAELENGRIPEGAYAQDEDLTEVVLPEGVLDIGEVAFYGCPNLRTVRFPDSLKTIREEAFAESGIEQVLLPEGLELIEEKAFFSCEQLRQVEVPGTDTVVGRDAFACCDKLHEAYIARGFPDPMQPYETIQYVLFWCSCPNRHTAETSARARAFLRENIDLVMEWILRFDNVAAMNGLVSEDIPGFEPDRYITEANLAGRSEITALLMTMHGPADESEFEL